jgi:hypothetical protein
MYKKYSNSGKSGAGEPERVLIEFGTYRYNVKKAK